MKGLTLTQQEQARLEVLNRVLERQLSLGQASQILGVSERHAWRILAAYRKAGAAALAHGNRGRLPSNAVSLETKRWIVDMAQTRYQGINHTHLTELLEERESIFLSRSTVRNILTRSGITSPRHRRPPKHRVRRERLPQEGMLIQIDGSHHDWLQGRGPRLTLFLAVDDATGTYPGALFRKEEDSLGYFLLLRDIIQCKGIPLGLYSDRHAVFRQVQGAPGSLREPTQFGRAMRDLGVAQIFALSPQAKGRIERANQTFQDRLVAELKLAGVTTAHEANRFLAEFLPRMNQRFGVPPAQPGTAYRSVASDLDVAAVLSFKYRRKVARDNTVKFQWRTLQLLPSTDRPTYAGIEVEVQVRLDGCLVICHESQVIPTQEAPLSPSVLRKRAGICTTIATCLAGGVIPVDGDQGGGVEVGGAKSKGAAAGSMSQSRRRTPAFQPCGTPADRRPTPRQQARWEAVQEARRRGLSLRAIGRELVIDNHTAKKYAVAIRPLTYSPRNKPVECTDDGLAEWADLTNLDTGIDSNGLSRLMASMSQMKARKGLLT